MLNAVSEKSKNLNFVFDIYYSPDTDPILSTNCEVLQMEKLTVSNKTWHRTIFSKLFMEQEEMKKSCKHKYKDEN